MLKATVTSPDVCPTCYQAPVIDCSICHQQALGRRTTNNGRPRCFTCQATLQIDAALTGPDDDPELRGVLARYARWHVVGRAETNRHGHLSAAVAGRCRGNIQTAKAFLERLAAHGHELNDCPQSCVDDWLAHDRGRRLGFLRWLKRNGHLPRIRLPDAAPATYPRHDTDPSRQLDLARQLLHDPDRASIEDRAAACLILLYAQPAAKIVTLTTYDLLRRGDDTYLRLGAEPLLLLPPLNELLAALPVAKPFGTASILADRRWLFTGKNAGTHLHPASLMRRMHKLGITSRASRNTALLHLASTTPPAVFASLICININTATRWAALAGAAWNSYATGQR